MPDRESIRTVFTTRLPAASHSTERGFVAKYGYQLAVTVLVILTRLPLLGNFLGEPDTARYVFGLRFWIATGPQSGSIVNPELSTGYYWLAAYLGNALKVSYGSFPLLLSTLSFLGTFPFAFSLFELGARLIGRRASFVATVLMLIGPSVWWAGIQGHPQILAGAAILSSMLAFVSLGTATTREYRAFLYCASSASFAIALLMKSDFVLYAFAYPSLYAATHKRLALGCREWFSYARLAAWPIFAGYVLYVVFKKIILQGANISSTESAVGHVLQWVMVPRGIDILIGQLTPAVFSHGTIALLAAGVGSLLWIHSPPSLERFDWLLILATWTLPQYLFYCVVMSANNARHLLIAPLPLFWLGASYLCRKKALVVAAVVGAIVAADFCIPPNSGSSLYPSPNVPASVRLMRHKQIELRRMAHLLMSGDTDRTCYFGLYTLDHVSAYLLEEVDSSGMHEQLLPDNAFRLAIRRADGTFFREVDVLFSKQLPAAPPCGIVESVEYSGKTSIRYFGSEWTSASLGSLLQDVMRTGK